MKLLLTNDDGYTSSGLMLLCEKLAKAGHDVYVVAPDTQKSAFSHSVNLYSDIKITKLDSYCNASEAYVCSGTPSDCVKFGIFKFGSDFDAVISGPNNGENYGFAVIYSGTVAAAEEGVMCGIKSIALSRLGRGGPFSSAVEYLVDNLNELLKYCDTYTLLNVNVPDLPSAQIKGVKKCELSLSRLFADVFVETENNNYKVVGDRQNVVDVDTDIAYANEGYITLTPISLCRTDFKKLKEMKA